MKTKIRIGFVDTFENAKRFFTWALQHRYDVIRDDESPDYLFYGDANFGQSHRDPKYNSCRKIFYTGEPVGRDYAGDDFAITFDHVNSPKHYRLPLYVIDMWAAVYDDKFTDDMFYLVNKKVPEGIHQAHKGLVSYVQTNPNQPVRTKFMETLFKEFPAEGVIGCAGPHLNNVGYVLPREGGHTAKWNFIKDYDFNVAFENGSRPGYVTEKILNAFYANTIPIYWGSSTVNRDFNPDAFIDVSRFESLRAVIDGIEMISKDDHLYNDFLTQPAFRDNIPPSCTNINNLLDWFEEFVV